MNVEFRAEAFNLFNHPHFGAPQLLFQAALRDRFSVPHPITERFKQS